MSDIDLNQLVAEQIQGIPYGTVQFTVKVHKMGMSKVDISRGVTHKIDSQRPQSEAAALIIETLKDNWAHNIDKNTIAFVVSSDHGRPVTVQIQKFIEKRI